MREPISGHESQSVTKPSRAPDEVGNQHALKQRVRDEAEPRTGIRAHTREEDDVGLGALGAIHSAHDDASQARRGQRTADLAHLRRIEREHAQRSYRTHLEVPLVVQLAHECHHDGGFVSIVDRAISALPLGAVGHVDQRPRAEV